MITDGIMCLNLKGHFWALLNNCRGQDLIEYALVAAMIGLGAVAAMSRLAEQIISAFSSIGQQLTNAL